MTLEDLMRIARAVAKSHGLPEHIVCGLVEQESSWNPWAWNPEPKYRWFWDVARNKPFRKVTDAEIALELPPTDFPRLHADRDQEWWAQQASFGLCQVMGAVARERQFKGPYLTELCDPIVGLTYGCVHLAALLKGRNLEDALLRYNGGGDPDYPTKVIALAKKYRP